MAAYGERGVLDRPNMRVMRWRNGALSGSDLANEPGLGSSRTYQPGEMPMPSKPKPGLTRMHREMNSEATSSGSPLRAAVPPKGAKVTQKVQTNQTIQDLDEMNDQLRSTKKELNDMTKTMLAMEEDRDMWRKLFEDCNKKQGQEIERLRQEYKERSEQVALTTSIEKVIPARDIPRGQSPMELLTPREMSQTTETRLPAETNRVTIPDPSDTLGDPVVEQTVRKLIETAGRLVANKNAPGSGVTAPYGTIDDTGRVQLSQTIIRQGISDVTPLRGSSKITERKVRKMPAKKVSRVIDVQKNNQLKYIFTGVPETDPRACFNRATWSPAVNLQQPPLGTSHLILGDSLVRVLSNLRTSWVTTVMAFGGATIAQLYRMVELMNPGKIPNVMILVGTNDISRGSDEQEALWEAMMVCLFTTLWQKFSCAVLTVCTVPMNTRSLTASGRRHNEGVMRWNNILRNLANRNAGRMILMDIEHELRAMDQARLTTDGIHFDSVEGQAWLNRVFQERLDELEAELFDTGVLKEEGTVSDTVITTFVPPNLETRLGTVPAVTNYRQQSSSEPGRRTDVQDRSGEAPMRRTIHPRRRIGPVNQPIEEVAGTYRSDTRSETTSTSREERPSRGSLMWSRSIPSPWHIYKEELMKLDLQRVSFIEDARRMLNGATLSVSRLYSITGVDWLIAASINFSSTTALRFADLEGLPSNNTIGPVNARPLQDVRLNHDERNREERPGRFLTARAPIGQHVKIFRQMTTPPGHVKERVYPKLVNQDGDAQRYGGLTAIKKDETIFAAYDKAEMRKAKIMVVANSEFVYTSKSLFWPDVIMLAAVDLDLLQSVSLAIGVQRQTEMNPITIVFAGINDHLHSRGFLSRLRDPATAEDAVWPAIKDILESMGEVVDATKEGSFNKVTLRVVFALSPGYAYLPDGLKFVYAMVALLSEGKYDVIISAPNRMIEMENLRPLKAELPAVWSDISNAMRGFKDHALHMLVLDEVLGLELSNFSRQLKLKPGIDDDHRVITAMSNDLWFRAMEVASEDTRRKNSLETRAHLEAMVLRTKPEANQWLHLNPRVAALGADAFQQGPVMITKIYAYLLKEVNLAENAGEKTAEFVNRMCQITLETFWTQEVKGQEGFERTDSMLEGLGAGWTASFLAKVYPKVSHYLIKEFLQAVVKVSIVDLLQSVSLAIGVQRQTEMNPITIVFAGINDHLHSRGFLSRLRDPATAEDAVWPAIKDILESMGEVVDATKEGSFNKVTLRVVFALSPGYAYLPDGLKFVYAMVALLSEGKYDVIISAPNRMIEMENLRPLKAELPAVWSDISNAMRGFKDHALHMLVLDEVLGLELSNFSRQLKLKPGIDDDHRVITAMSNDLWFRAMEVASEDTRRKNSLETRAHLEAMVLRTKPEANQWLHLNPRVAALGADAFQQGPVMITKIYAYLLKEVNLAENAGEKTAEFVNRMCQITLETFWTQEVKGQEGFERTDSMLEGLGAGWTASFLAKVYPKVSHYLIKEFLQAVVKVSIVELIALFVTFGAENFVKGPVILLTDGIQNLRLDGLLTLTAITHGNLGALMKLARCPEQMKERVRNLDMKKSTDSWNKIRDLRHTLIQYLLQQNRFGTGEDETIDREEDVRRHVGGMPLLTDLSLAMRTDPWR